MDFEALLLVIIIVYVLHRLGLIKIHWSYRWSLNKEDKSGSDKFSQGIDQLKKEKKKLKGQIHPDK